MKTYTQEELNKILKDNELWVISNKTKGAPANFENSQLQEVNFQGKILTNANFQGANLSNANFQGADLRDSKFNNANLYQANLSGALLEYADFFQANLWGANLWDSSLIGANLLGADLDYSCMPLWCGDLCAHYDDKQVIQQLYHVLNHAINSKNASQKIKNVLIKPEILKLANEFHRIDKCGKLEFFVNNEIEKVVVYKRKNTNKNKI